MARQPMNHQLIEIASWRIVSELCRRYPGKFTVLETHPGGGQYDCLSLFDKKQKHIADFNRAGRFHVSSSYDGVEQREPFAIWPEMMEEYDQKRVLDKVSDDLGLPIPAKLPAALPTTVVYRFIAAFLSHAVFGVQRWYCINGVEDASGYGGGIRNAFFEQFPQARGRLEIHETTDFFREPAYRFWFICKEENPVLCIETNGVIWTATGKAYNLKELYAAKHRIWPLVMEVAGDLFP